jgi:3-oxoacyl-[acyl-carrier-protein] synthase II
VTDRVVITGLGAISPLGLGARALFERWAAGESGIIEGLGRCWDFLPDQHLSKKELRRTDRFTQMAIVAADEAIDQATRGGDSPLGDPERVGVIIGTGAGGMTTVEDSREIYDARPREDRAIPKRKAAPVPPLTVPKMMANAPSGFVSMRHGLQGPAFAVVSACAAATDAIGVALRLLRSGQADVVITGGTESSLTEFSIDSFAAMEATSGSGICRPFDARRDGFILGEGAGMLVLENERNARERGAPLVGYLLGHGGSSDAYHLVAPEPNGRGAVLAMQRALDDAGLAAEDIDYINAHGTSTPLNDRSETRALKSTFNGHAHRIPVSSTKSAVGHLLGAAGAVEAVATVQALTARIAPPTLNWEQREDGMDLDYVPDVGRHLRTADHRPAIGLSNSFGFGGHNSVLCLAGGEPWD